MSLARAAKRRTDLMDLSPIARTPGLIPVIILNWNGEEDTIACLKSIHASGSSGILPVVVDNGSKPASVRQLKDECSQLFGEILCIGANEVSTERAEMKAELGERGARAPLVFIENRENLGFAKANNIGIRFAELTGASWVMLLNNDAIVAPDAFEQLRKFLHEHSDYCAITPQIRHFMPNTRIQNCGGDLTYFGSRKYKCADREVSDHLRSGFSVITFITGCALLFNFKVTGLLSEDFFFGEEDYEFSLRMKSRGLKMACVNRALIYHKGGATITRNAQPLGAILVHYANRLLNTRSYYSNFRWHATRLVSYIYLPLLLAKSGINPRRSIEIIRRVELQLKRSTGINSAVFRKMSSVR